MKRPVAPKPTSAVIYLRVSTQKQAESGAGMEAQLAACQKHAERLGLPVLSVHQDDGISGKDDLAKRPGLREAIKAVQDAPGSILVVYSLSRLGRSQRIIWNLLDDRGDYRLPLASATEAFETSTPSGRAMLGMLGVWAQLEADLVSERTIAAMAALKARGVRLGGPTQEMRIPETLAKIREMYATGQYTMSGLAAHLNAAGVPTAKPGHRWHKKTVSTALKGPERHSSKNALPSLHE